MSTAHITITVNGTLRQVAEGMTVAQLLGEMGLGEHRVAVEKNRQVVPRAVHGTARIEAGDTLEIVTFVGGG